MGEQSTFLNIMLIILSLAFLLFAAFSIPFLLQIWRTAKGMSQTLQLLNESLPAIMKNLEEIMTNLNRTTTTVQRQVLEFSLTLRRIQGVISLLVGLEEVLRSRIRLPFAGTVRTSAAMIRGARAFLSILLDNRREERGSSQRKELR
jgi:uncharacterized protein YoxC